MKFIRNSKFEIQNFRRGFTLIEMIVVVFVVGIGLIGALSFFSINISNQNEAKNELIAAGLAQEGTELVRNIRDYNILSGKTWYDFFPLIGGVDNCKRIDYRSLDNTFALGLYFHKCYGSNFWDDDVYFDKNKGKYFNRFLLEILPVSAVNTNFKRSISITSNGNLDADGYLEVTCTVSWNGRTTTAKDILYNNSY